MTLRQEYFNTTPKKQACRNERRGPRPRAGPRHSCGATLSLGYAASGGVNLGAGGWHQPFVDRGPCASTMSEPFRRLDAHRDQGHNMEVDAAEVRLGLGAPRPK